MTSCPQEVGGVKAQLSTNELTTLEALVVKPILTMPEGHQVRPIQLITL